MNNAALCTPQVSQLMTIKPITSRIVLLTGIQQPGAWRNGSGKFLGIRYTRHKYNVILIPVTASDSRTTHWSNLKVMRSNRIVLIPSFFSFCKFVVLCGCVDLFVGWCLRMGGSRVRGYLL